MNADRWQAVNALFHAVLDADGAEREALLRTRAEADPELVEEVRSLLARHQPGAQFLEAPAWAVAASLMADDAPSLVGKKIGSYQILEEIGRGGMGVVYAARDERLGRTVALKALPPEYTRDRRHRERLAREARAAAAFTHESIATVFALEEIDGELYIASELVEGDTLRAELARGPVASDRLIATLVDIASGLSAAHARNIIHRDLKPENFIRRTDGHIKILDFGLARITDPDNRTVTRLTEEGTAPGTPGYMAPEQLSGGDVDGRTDLFAFGVVAWELATGEHPFGSNPAAMLARMMEGRPATLPRQLSVPALDPIVRRCLRVSPADRYASADELLADLKKLTTPSGTLLAMFGAGDRWHGVVVVAVSPGHHDRRRRGHADPCVARTSGARPVVPDSVFPGRARARDGRRHTAAEPALHLARPPDDAAGPSIEAVPLDRRRRNRHCRTTAWFGGDGCRNPSRDCGGARQPRDRHARFPCGDRARDRRRRTSRAVTARRSGQPRQPVTKMRDARKDREETRKTLHDLREPCDFRG